MNPGELEALIGRLAEERERLERLRSDYTRITESRFHALRMLWFSAKALFVRDGAEDRYAVWSRGVGPSLAQQLHVHLGRDRIADETERRLVETWTARIGVAPAAPLPVVSVVIPVYNHRDVTIRCLQSLVDTWPASLGVQVIVVDDGSSETLAALVSRLRNIDYVCSSTNEGFIRSCNLGAALARGRYLLFLNNDTILHNAAIDYLVSTAERDPTVGVVGPKLLFPDGRLQCAGGIVWHDATGWEYGKFDNPLDSRYNYVRDVDYVAGSALLVRTEIFRALGGFGKELQRAYYEDTDLCFSVQRLGYRNVYQPLSEVVHVESASSPDDATGMRRFLEVNRPTFREKWASELKNHYKNSPANVPAGARRLRRRPTVLIVDKHVPLYDKDSGSRRLMHVVQILRRLQYHVMFLPDNYAALQPYTQELQQMGVEVIHHIDQGRPMDEALEEILPLVDIAWICRPDLYEQYEPKIRRDHIRFIYDTVDLHFVRKKREAELYGGDDSEWKQWQNLELGAARDAEATVVVTNDERTVLEDMGIPDVHVVPNIHTLETNEARDFRTTSGVLFIGNYNHEPNVDACVWLVTEIMPLVWREIPKATLTLVGAYPSERVLNLETERVRISGYVPDVTPYFMQSRIFVAPLRYGAGMKGKIGQALAYRLPVVTTPVGAEGFGFVDREHLLVSEAKADRFADAIVELYRDEKLWRKLSENSESALVPFGPAAVEPAVQQLIEDVYARVSATSDLRLTSGDR